MIIERVEVMDKAVSIYLSLPGPEAGYTKGRLLAAFVDEMQLHLHDIAPSLLGGVMRLNGRMTTEVAMAAGAIAVRLGATRVELFDPSTGTYVPVLGEGGALDMPVQLLPGMVVEVVQEGGLFRPGARAVVLNVGRDSVNIADADATRRRRDTGWTARENVRPVGWEITPLLRRGR